MQQDKPSGALPNDHALYAPGLKWRSRIGGDVPMWIPPGAAVKAGYLPKSLMLDRHASPHEIAEVCRKQWKDLEDWRTGKTKPVKLTITWLIDRYLADITSPFQRLKPDTQQSYRWECQRIQETVGDMRLDPRKENGIFVPRRTGEDFQRWFHNWGHPEDKLPTPSRATHCIAMLRALISYYVVIGGAGAVALRDVLSEMRFEKPGARNIAPTFEQVDAIVKKAEEFGFRSIAITTLAQFELIERRTHVIGQWNRDAWGYGWVWDGHLQLAGRTVWVGVSPDWRIRYYQTKKDANLREFDLNAVPRLLGLLQLTPNEQRKGPIIICETTGQPWEKRRYQEKFREIARAAGVPDEVYSMDMRAGGATEADDIPEITDRMFDDSGGWADPNMKNRYRRNKQRNAQKVVQFRQAARDKR
jgi:hypothetical protein